MPGLALDRMTATTATLALPPPSHPPRSAAQPVAWQTGFNAVVAMELLAEGAWLGAGVFSAESFDPDPYVAILDRDGIHRATIEIEPGRAVA